MSGTMEHQRAKEDDATSEGPTYIILHRVCCDQRQYSDHSDHPYEAFFLDPPRKFKGDGKDKPLRGKQKLTDKEEFLHDKPELSFIVHREYSCRDYHHLLMKESAFEMLVDAEVFYHMPEHIQPFLFRLTEDAAPATPVSEKIYRFSKPFLNAMSMVQKLDSPRVELLDDWNDEGGPTHPYLVFFHTKTVLETFSTEVGGPDGQQIDLLLQYLDLRVGQEYKEAGSLFQSGVCTSYHFNKLFRRGQIVIKDTQGHVTAFIVRTCSYGSTIRLDCETWAFDEKFHRESKTLEVSCPTGSGNVPISSLSVAPLQYDGTGLEERLIARGRMVWSCRNGGLVTSVAPRQGFEIKLVSERPNELTPTNAF